MSTEDIEISVNGIHLNVLVEGEGDPVLLLHGFPDSSRLWRGVIPRLTGAGYRAIAPDQRGFGRSEAPEGTKRYEIEIIAEDAISVLDELGIAKAKLVGHDWGAVIGWFLSGKYPERFESLVAVSVGHPKAYASAGFEQKLKGWYILFFQLRGIAEKVLMARDWSLFRRSVHDHPETNRWIADLSRPGRLTAALNWYRANVAELWKPDVDAVKLPVLGIWSAGDVALTEAQMIGSAAFVDAAWRYERFEGVGHWIPLDEPARLSEVILGYYRS